MAYSNDGAFLAVSDEKKVITVFTVADGYSVRAMAAISPLVDELTKIIFYRALFIC